jgi:hypothetical protein
MSNFQVVENYTYFLVQLYLCLVHKNVVYRCHPKEVVEAERIVNDKIDEKARAVK